VPETVKRTAGMVKLGLVGSANEIAKRTGLRANSIRDYTAGRRIPRPPTQAVIEEQYPTITPKDWRTPAGPVGGGTQLGLAPVPRSDDPRELAQALTARVRVSMAQLDQLVSDGSVVESSRVYERLSRTLVSLGKFSGVGLSKREILMSPHFVEIVRVITGAIEPWPDALRAAAQALEGLERAADER
jgi:hypothetical protein